MILKRPQLNEKKTKLIFLVGGWCTGSLSPEVLGSQVSISCFLFVYRERDWKATGISRGRRKHGSGKKTREFLLFIYLFFCECQGGTFMLGTFYNHTSHEQFKYSHSKNPPLSFSNFLCPTCSLSLSFPNA